MSKFAALMGLALFGSVAVAAGPLLQYEVEGRRLMAQGEPDKAALSFEEALRVNPFDPVALNNLAVARAEAGDYNTSLDLLKRAARLAPVDNEIAANLSRLRGWLNSFEVSGQDVPRAGDPLDQRVAGSLPPPPPPLWEPIRRH